MAHTKHYESLHDLFLLKLHSLYDIEKILVGALPKMARAATDKDLKSAFLKHLGETENHVTRLEEAFKELSERPGKEKVEAIRGLEKDAAWVLKNIENDAARDAALIGAAQHVEHYEMAGYGAAHEWADLMEHGTVAELLRATLAEEEAADTKLNELAKGGINQTANIGMTPMEKLVG